MTLAVTDIIATLDSSDLIRGTKLFKSEDNMQKSVAYDGDTVTVTVNESDEYTDISQICIINSNTSVLLVLLRNLNIMFEINTNTINSLEVD